MNRRKFLFSLGATLLLACAKKAQGAVLLLQDLKLELKRVSKRMFVPGDSAFSELKTLINPALTPADPIAILRSNDLKEIQSTLDLCRKENIPVRIRSGGHSFEGFSMGEGVDIDIRDFKTFKVTSTHVVAGSGWTLGELKDLLEGHGLSFPTGTCPTVGLGGYLLGGGHSIKSRLWGLGADRVQGMKVILANGQRLFVSSTHHQDLYGALLGGGGGNFAIVEEFYLDLIPSGQDFIFNYFFSTSQAALIFEMWEQHALTEDNAHTVQLLLSFYSGKLDRVQIYGVFNRVDLKGMEPLEVFRQSVWSKLDDLNPSAKDFKTVSSNTKRKEGGLTLPFKGHSHFADHAIGANGFAQILSQASQTLPGTRLSMVFEPLGGAIKNPSRSNSYPHRSSIFNIEFYLGFKELRQKDFSGQALTRFHQGLAPLFSGRCYVNYPNLDLQDRALSSYYGESVAQLQLVKKRYDAGRVFNFGEQSLR